MLLPPLAGLIVVGLGPRAVPQAGERKRPQRFAQGMDAGAANVHGAGRPALSRDRSGARLALGNVRIAIPVAIIAQFSDHPGGENISSTGQAEIELAVRMESQYPFDLSFIDIDVFGKRLQMRRKRSGQTCLGPNDGRRDVKAWRLHTLVDGCSSRPAVRTVMVPQESL